MTRRQSGLVLALMTAGSIGLLASPALAQDGDRDCPDFSSQREAQRFFQSQAGDPDRLDRDNDGIACEDGEGGGTTQAQGGGNAAEETGELPFTGPRENAIIATTGAGLLAAGIALTVAGRRRPETV